jgi:retron-type reverse transcriptase
MKRFGNLYASVTSFENLMGAARKALRGKKSKSSAASFYFHMENEVIALQEELTSGSYIPSSYHLFEIREPKVRQICSSDFRDRVVHHAICNVIDPFFERRLIFDTYACRRGKGAHAALKRAQDFVRLYPYFLKCDIQKYFQSIDHEILKNLLGRIIKDDQLLALLDLIIDHAVPGNEIGKGIPIGNLTSQHFANFYLGEFDHYLKEECRLPGYVRYMDDFICFAEDKSDLAGLLEKIQEFIDQKLKLQLKEKVTRIAPVTEGVPFLGFRIFSNLIRLQRPNLIRLRRKLKSKENLYQRGQITETELASSVRSMVAHIAHANSTLMRRREFESSLSLA